MTAREWLEGVRAAQLAVTAAREAHDAALERMQPHGSGGGGSHGSGGHGPMDSMPALIDREADYYRLVLDARRLALDATDVLYGRGGTDGGLSAILGERYADALYLRYVEALDWRGVCERMGYGTDGKYPMALARRAMAEIDARGRAACRDWGRP